MVLERFAYVAASMNEMEKDTQVTSKLIAKWLKTLVERDREGAENLRSENFIAISENGDIYSRSDELDLVFSDTYQLQSAELQHSEIRHHGDVYIAVFCTKIRLINYGVDFSGTYFHSITFVWESGNWKALCAHTSVKPELLGQGIGTIDSGVNPTGGESAESEPSTDVRSEEDSVDSRAVGQAKSLGYLPYIPYAFGRDSYLIEGRELSQPSSAAELPVPPSGLRLGYSSTRTGYLSSGEVHTQTMLEIAKESGYVPQSGDLILDVGCGAGRMIRNLFHLSNDCEIWGIDINSEAIFLGDGKICRRRLTLR